MRIALVTARAARGLDEDEPPLRTALQASGCEADTTEWDDPGVDWASYDLVLLRSAWDYAERLAEFLDWAGRVSALTQVQNPLPVVRWNTDKHYLAHLSGAGIAIVPSRFLEPGADPLREIDTFFAERPNAEIVIKPAVGAGSRDAQRHRHADKGAAVAHAKRLLDANRSVLLQPYLRRVEQEGETALMFFEGRFSHAIRKGPLLPPGGAATTTLFAAETIHPRTPGADELRLAERIIAAIPHGTLLYARVDLIRDDDGAPCLLELELTEPSLFLSYAAGSAERFTQALTRRYPLPHR